MTLASLLRTLLPPVAYDPAGRVVGAVIDAEGAALHTATDRAAAISAAMHPSLEDRHALLGEWFGVGTGLQRVFSLRVDGVRTGNIGRVAAIYCHGWQGNLKLSPAPRTNLLYPSDASRRWGFFGSARATVAAGILDPEGGLSARRITCIQSGGDLGPHYPGNSSALIPGQLYTFAIALRGAHGGEAIRIGVDGGSVTPTYATLTRQWQLLTYTAPYRAGDVYALRLIQPDPGTSIEHACAGIYDGDTAGSVIPTMIGPVTLIDYTVSHTGTLQLSRPPSAGAVLRWDGEVFYSLSDWEHVLALMPPPNATPQERVQAVLAKLGELGGLSIPYFVRLAAAAGYAVTITEPKPWRVGHSHVDEPLYRQDVLFVWQVHIDRRPPSATPVTDAALEATFNNLKPAHTFCQFLES